MKRLAAALVAAIGLHLLAFAWTPSGLLLTPRLQKTQKISQPAQRLALRLVPSVWQAPDPSAGPIVPPAAVEVPPAMPVASTQQKTPPVNEAPVSKQHLKSLPPPPVSAVSPSMEEPAPSSLEDLKEVAVAADPPLPAVKVNSTPRFPEEAHLPPPQADAAADGVVQFESPVVVASIDAVPLYRQNPPPSYPRIARQRRWQGSVMLEVLVSEEGLPQDIRIVASSGHEVLDQAAGKAVAGWLFAPGRRNDVPVAMRVRVPVRFELAGR